MNIFSWDDSFDVGNEIINKQHKHLINQINMLSDAMHSGKSRDVMGNILKELAAYGVKHFQTEEDLFKQHHYAHTATHTKAHDDFKATVTDLITKFDSGSMKVSLETLHFLREWIINHILKEDMKYKGIL